MHYSYYLDEDNHESKYYFMTIGEDNPKTGDKIYQYLIIGGVSVIGVIGISIYLKKKNRHVES